MSISKCRIIELPKVFDTRGNLTFIENARHIPFDVKRIFYLYDVPGGQTRGGHAQRYSEQFIIAASGSFDVVVDDGRRKKIYSLNRSYYGLYIPTMVWRELNNFSSGSVCLVLTSTYFDKSDYIRSYRLYKKNRGKNITGNEGMDKR